MKNIFFAFCLIISCVSLKAQDTLHIKIGFFFAPQGGISLNNPSEGFTTITPVSFVTTFSKGENVLNAMYNMTFNKVQVVYWRELGSSTGVYASLNKSVLARGGYASLGVTGSVASGRAIGFLDIGSNWHKWTPTFYIGAIIPLTVAVK